MDDQHESQFRLPDQFQLNTVDQNSHVQSLGALTFAGSSFGSRYHQVQYDGTSTFRAPKLARLRLSQLQKDSATQNTADAEPVTSIATFMAAVAEINPPFKPRTLHRPWSISAGSGAHGAVEVHRYVRGRNWDVFNESSSLKLLTYQPDPKRTGDYYAVKRLGLLHPEAKGKETKPQRNPYALLIDELRILAHPDLRGHPNIVYLFGVSHTPSWGEIDSAEPNLVLQEGDCGDLFSLYRDVHMGYDRHTLLEVKMSLCFDIACGIEALHRHGVVHCDIKPQNILIRRRSGRDQPILRCQSEIEAGQVALQSLRGESPFVAMLADFGGSIIMDDQPGDTVLWRVMSPLWCAPECHSGAPIAKNLFPRVDIYSAGLVFAFIFLEGRGIFTTVVERGLMHQYDTTMNDETVRAKKIANAALDLAVEQVKGLESSVFGVTATGQRLYTSRDQFYPPVVSGIFASILGLALQADPSKRVANATDLLEPWHRALQGDFHVKNSLHYSQPAAFRAFSWRSEGRVPAGKTCVQPGGPGHRCTPVPQLFSSSDTDLDPEVFDIRKSFKIFRVSLTSNLKTAILNDMLQKVKCVQLEKNLGWVRVLPTAPQLRRGAGYAYQVGLAYLEGFGCPRDDQEALRRMKTAAEWGLSVAQADVLPLSVSLGGYSHDKGELYAESIGYDFVKKPAVVDRPDKSDSCLKWAFDAIVGNQAHQGTVNALWHVNHEVCTDAVSEYRAERQKKVQIAFELRMSKDWKVLDTSGEWKIRLRMLHESSLSFGGILKTAAHGGWTLLHYIVAGMSIYGGIGATFGIRPATQLRFLVEELEADVRSLNEDSATALDLAMASGNTTRVSYLLDRHQLCSPPFLPGSCPLQNVACLPFWFISKTIDRVCSMAPEMSIDARLPTTTLPQHHVFGVRRTQTTGRTALLNIFLTIEPLLPEARKAAVLALLDHGANPLLMTAEPGTASPLLLAVTSLESDLVASMLLAIKKFGHGLPNLNLGRAPAEPANELARAFLRLVQTPRSVILAKGVAGHRLALGAIIKSMLEHHVCVELPHVCRGMKHDLLGLACYYGRDDVMQAILTESSGVGPAVSKTLGWPGWGQPTGIEALKTAIDCGFVEAVDLLLPDLAKIPQVITDQSLLLIDALHHQPALVPHVLSHLERAGRGREVLEFKDPWGATILDLALEYGYLDLARQLLAKGAKYDVYRLQGDHNIDDGPESTLASVLPRMKPIQLLMEQTPKPRLIVTSTGLNVFHVLAANDKLIGTTVGRAEFLEVMEYFHRLDPTLIHARGGTRGITPFHVVSLFYSETVGAFLHAHGADINAPSNDGRHTPLDLLHFHENGDRGPDEHLTIDYRATGGPRTGVAICDYGMAGPVYWKLEDKLLARMKELYRTWGAERSLQGMMKRLGLGRELDDVMFFRGGITEYYMDENGVERSRHIS